MEQAGKRKWFAVCCATVLFGLFMHLYLILSHIHFSFSKNVFWRGELVFAGLILIYSFFLRIKYGSAKELRKEKRFKIVVAIMITLSISFGIYGFI